MINPKKSVLFMGISFVAIAMVTIFYRGGREVSPLPSIEECTCHCHQDHEREIKKISPDDNYDRRLLIEEMVMESKILMQEQSKFCSAPFLKNLEELKN